MNTQKVIEETKYQGLLHVFTFKLYLSCKKAESPLKCLQYFAKTKSKRTFVKNNTSCLPPSYSGLWGKKCLLWMGGEATSNLSAITMHNCTGAKRPFIGSSATNTNICPHLPSRQNLLLVSRLNEGKWHQFTERWYATQSNTALHSHNQK